MQNSRLTNAESIELVNRLIINWEDETVEFKEANDNFKTSDIGKYVSALSNEANLTSTNAAWLVFGVHNKARKVIGTSYRTDKMRLDLTKKQIFEGTSPNLALREIHVVDHPGGRVVMFEIPPAPRSVPISWHGHYYSRAGESLMPLSLDKLDQIRRQSSQLDWTAQVVDDADASD